MIIEDLKHFFNTGELSNFPFGTPREIIIEKLGKSEDGHYSRESSFLKYDRTEFYFDHTKPPKKVLMGVMIQPVTGPSPKLNLEMNCEWLKSEKTLPETETRFLEEGVSVKREFSKIDGSEILVSNGGVEILFFDEDGTICKAGKFVDNIG